MVRFLCVLFIIAWSTTPVISQNPEIQHLHDLLYQDGQKGDVYWIHPDSAKKFYPIASQLFLKYPGDDNALNVLRYCFYQMKVIKPFTPERMDSLGAVFDKYRNSFPLTSKNYNRLSSIAISLGIYARLGNDLPRQKEYSELGIQYCKKGVDIAKAEGDLETEVFGIYKLSNLYNNLGLSLYSATHPFDPLEKRNQVGPLIERYWLKSDSCYNLAFTLDKGHNILYDSYYDPTIKNNLSLLYGHYYYNELKSELYYQQAMEILKDHPNPGVLGQLIGTRGWNKYCRQEWEESIPILKEALTYLDPNSKTASHDFNRVISDCHFGLSMCNYRLHNYDSSIHWANIFLADTVWTKDFLHISSLTSTLSEIYLVREDVKNARFYLDVSKKYLAKSQNEAVVNTFIKEGETIMVNEIFEKVNHLTHELDIADRNTERIKMILWFLIAGLSLFAGAYFIYRMRLIKSLPWQSQ